jgi:hypothetical protein
VVAVCTCLLGLARIAGAVEPPADAFVTVSGTLVGHWPSNDQQCIAFMQRAGLTRQGNYMEWRTTDTSGTLIVVPIPDGRFAMITYIPARQVEIAPGLLEALINAASGKEYGGPDELSIKFNGTIGRASYEDAVVVRLPRGTWAKTVRTLSAPGTKP